MRGFAIIDRQPGSDAIAVWITSASGGRARHVNAVVIDAGDSDVVTRIHSLTRVTGVLATAGSDLVGLPFDDDPLTVDDLTEVLDQAEELQSQILSAIQDYAVRPDPKTGRRPKSPRKIVRPEFPRRPQPEAFHPSEDIPAQRALATANYVAKVWNVWLHTEEVRRHRTVSPTTGETPWMMPKELNSPAVATLPDRFAARMTVQSLV